MLEVKSPWNEKILEKVQQNNDGQIEKILAKASITSKIKVLIFHLMRE